jgi:hypothetical protein
VSCNGLPGESSAAVAHAVAAISVSLPGAPANARARLAAVVAECNSHDYWSDATQVALLRLATAWLAISCRLGRPLRDIQNMDSADLLAVLRETCAHRDPVEPNDGGCSIRLFVAAPIAPI